MPFAAGGALPRFAAISWDSQSQCDRAAGNCRHRDQAQKRSGLAKTKRGARRRVMRALKRECRRSLTDHDFPTNYTPAVHGIESNCRRPVLPFIQIRYYVVRRLLEIQAQQPFRLHLFWPPVFLERLQDGTLRVDPALILRTSRPPKHNLPLEFGPEKNRGLAVGFPVLMTAVAFFSPLATIVVGSSRAMRGFAKTHLSCHGTRRT